MQPPDSYPISFFFSFEVGFTSDPEKYTVFRIRDD